MRLTLVALVGMGCASAALAQPYYLRGEFNGWGTSAPMAETAPGSGVYTAQIGSLTPGAMYEYKCAVQDWSWSAPGSNGRLMANAAGMIDVRLVVSAPADGWKPDSGPRVGYADSGLHGWDLMGSVNGWSSPFANLFNLGGGLYAVEVLIPAGSYEFKFRKAGDWGISIGGDFGNAAGNATFNSDGVLPTLFELDLPNGRWRTTAVPTPGALALLGLAGMTALRRRR